MRQVRLVRVRPLPEVERGWGGPELRVGGLEVSWEGPWEETVCGSLGPWRHRDAGGHYAIWLGAGSAQGWGAFLSHKHPVN